MKLIKGGTLSSKSLKNINLFEFNSLEEQYLNPTYGYYWYTIPILNFLKFFPVNEENKIIGNIAKYIHNIYYARNNIYEVFLSKKYNTLTIKELGQLIGLLYIFHMNPNIENKKQNTFFYNEFIKEYNFSKEIKSLFNELKSFSVNQKGNLISYQNKEELKFYFHILLSLVWKLSENKSNIQEYYDGLLTILEYIENFNLKTNTINTIYTINNFIDITQYDTIEEQLQNLEFSNLIVNDFNNVLALYHKLYIDASLVYLDEFSYVDIDNTCSRLNINNISFPDCGETSLRNFLKIAIYNKITGNYDINILRHLRPNRNVMEYFRIFNSEEKMNKNNRENIIINEELYTMNYREAWGFLVANLPNVQYNKPEKSINENFFCKGEFCYEIKSGWFNMKNVISNLFSNIELNNDIRLFEQFGFIVSVEEDEEDEDYESEDEDEDEESNTLFKKFGKIKFDNYEWEFMDGHFQINIRIDDNKYNNIIYNVKNEFEDIMLKSYKSKNNNVYFNKYRKIEDIFNIFNNLEIEKEIYNGIFKYLDKKSKENEGLLPQIYVDRYMLNNKNIINYSKADYERRISYDKEKKYLYYGYNTIIKNILDEYDIKTLEFSNEFNSTLDYIPNCEHIIFSQKFNQPLQNLPETLKILEFSTFSTFNYPIQKNNLPNNIKKIIIGNEFKNTLDLPNSLEILEFKDNNQFNTTFRLPPNLLELKLSYNYNQLLEFPNSLQTLILQNKNNQQPNLPINLIHLKINNNYYLSKLPNTLKTLEIGDDITEDINTFPSNLNKLILGDEKFNRRVYNLPDTLKILHTGFNYNQPLQLPNELVELKLGYSYEQPLDFPDSLKKFYSSKTVYPNIPETIIELKIPNNVKLNKKYNNLQKIINLNNMLKKEHIPETLKEIDFGSFNLPLPEYLYDTNIEKITFGWNFNQPIYKNSLPKNLKHLEFGFDFNQKIYDLPDTLEVLILGDETIASFNIVLPDSLKQIHIYSGKIDIQDEYLNKIKILNINNLLLNDILYNKQIGGKNKLQKRKSSKQKSRKSKNKLQKRKSSKRKMRKSKNKLQKRKSSKRKMRKSKNKLQKRKSSKQKSRKSKNKLQKRKSSKRKMRKSKNIKKY
jgi:hypothetical protein